SRNFAFTHSGKRSIAVEEQLDIRGSHPFCSPENILPCLDSFTISKKISLPLHFQSRLKLI
uniref:Ovule protein n=1 Tax=Brugia timori TaxID=42155 RepID=A0A0R3QAJ7_9BILA